MNVTRDDAGRTRNQYTYTQRDTRVVRTRGKDFRPLPGRAFAFPSCELLRADVSAASRPRRPRGFFEEETAEPCLQRDLTLATSERRERVPPRGRPPPDARAKLKIQSQSQCLKCYEANPCRARALPRAADCNANVE